MVAIIVIIALWVVFIITCVLARRSEARQFNGGKCINCGHDLRHFDTDSQGGNGYVCDKCRHSCWISYHSIERSSRHKRYKA